LILASVFAVSSERQSTASRLQQFVALESVGGRRAVRRSGLCLDPGKFTVQDPLHRLLDTPVAVRLDGLLLEKLPILWVN
jgi:hypothetical protein